MRNDGYYWDKRYLNNGTSGDGSTGEYREFKWNIINKYIPIIDNVLDVGCGDLRFWHERNCEHYTGLDISPTIIEKNKKQRPHWKFIVNNAEVKLDINLNYDVVFCNDLLFHILDEVAFKKILSNLCNYSNNYIFIFNWHKNPLKGLEYYLNLVKSMKLGLLFRNLFLDDTSDGMYQKYRNLVEYNEIFETRGFKLVDIQLAPIKPYIGAMYVFKKI